VEIGVEFYKSVLDNIDDGVYFVDRDRRISYWSQGAERITGYPSEAVLGRSCADGILVHVDGSGISLCQSGCLLAATMEDGEPRQAHLYLHHSEGHRLPVVVRSTPIRGPSGEVEGAVETFSDNSRLQTALKRVHELSAAVVRDPLTGIGNRRSVESQLKDCLAECRRSGRRMGALFVDIDHFKAVNDNYGHDVGDQVLKMVANTLKRNLRVSDVIGRWGGEEFVAVIKGIEEARLLVTAEKLRMLVANSFLDLQGDPLGVTISLGATLTHPEDTPKTLVKRADSLLYRSKTEGRNRVTFGA
jgi:diguanylate cyclase (GGDEF)-like protein/PAS domain S-box-containing protein